MPIVTFRVPGPVTIEYYNGSYVSMGGTKDGCNIRIRTSWIPVTCDMHGTEPADFIFGGKSAIVEAIFLDPAQVKLCDPWAGFGGIGMNKADGYKDVGGLASSDSIGRALRITEADGTSIWIANIAVPTDPDPAAMRATQEQQLPLSFLIVPDSTNKLFSTVPSYIT